MSLLWIDWVIVGIVCFYVIDGWKKGFAMLLVGIISFIISFWLAIRYHVLVGTFIIQKLGIGTIWTDIIGYIVVSFVSEYIISELLSYAVSMVPKNMLESELNRYIGAVFSCLKALVFVSLVLLVILSIPFRGGIKTDIAKSTIGSYLVRVAERYGGEVTSSLDQTLKEKRILGL
jgi:membrane protein required for colicin V production